MLSITFKKCGTPTVADNTVRQQLPTILYVTQPNYFVVHNLMLQQILINSVCGFSVHGVHLKNFSGSWAGPQEWQCPTRSPRSHSGLL